MRSMEIVVLSASRQKNCTLKDVAGGFGTVFTVGNSPFAKLLEIAKRRIASIPNITLAYLDSLLSSHGANVRVLEIGVWGKQRPGDGIFVIGISVAIIVILSRSYHLRPRYVWRFLLSTLLYPLSFPEPRLS